MSVNEGGRTSPGLRGLTIALGLVAFLGGAGWWFQRETSAALRSELSLLREDRRELAALQSERDRLRAAQPAAAELERLRGDRSALLRLKAEIDALQARAERVAKAGAEADRPIPAAAAAHAFNLTVAADGKLAMAGQAIELATLQQAFATLARGDRVGIMLIVGEGAKREALMECIKAITALANERGLKPNFSLDRPPE
jgi:hypothetical protein